MLKSQNVATSTWTEGADSLGTAGFALLLASAAVLPFELKTPLFAVGPIGITSVEVVIYLTIAVWGASRLTTKRLNWSAAHTAIAAWGLVLVISALLAPSYRFESVKFALRSLGGCALCFAVADFIRSPRSAALTGLALLAGSIISAASALAEAWLPGASRFLEYFKTGPSLSGSYVRASGTFQYANIASMYWEASLPFALIVLFWMGWRSGKRGWRWVGVVSCLLLVEAILLACSRAGIAIAALALIFLVWISRNAIAPLRPFAVFSLIALIVLLSLHLATDNLFVLRLTTPDTSTWYRADYADFPRELTVEAGKLVRVPLALRNTGRVLWRSHGRQAVAVSYHWMDASAANYLIWDGARTELPADVAPGKIIEVMSWILAPRRPGRYVLQWDMLQEEVAWFSIFAPSKAQVNVQVAPSASADFKVTYPPLPPVLLQPSRADLWRSALSMWREWPLFGAGPDNFRRLYGPYLGLKSFDDRIYANNLYLEMLANTGIMGMFAFAAVLAVVSSRWRKVLLRSAHPADRLLVVGFGLAVGAYLLHGLVDYFLAFSCNYGQFWILTGAIVGLGQEIKSR